MESYIGANGSYNQVSDARFKRNISGLNSILSKVMQLQPKEYEYIKNNPTIDRSMGFIAQEVLPLFPMLTSELKHPDKNEKDNTIYYGVNYAGFSV